MRFVHRRGAKKQVALVASLLMASTLGASAATAATHPAKKLSQSNITVAGSSAGDIGLFWIAQEDGLFKKNGLNATFINTSGQSTAATAAEFLGGGYNFVLNGASASFSSRQAGAPLEALIDLDEGEQVEVTISTTAAAALHIPAADATEAQAVAQIKALKGSHITVAVTNTTALSYADLVSILQHYGLTYGVNSTTSDVDFVTTGTSAAQVAGFLANKYDTFATNPPQADQPNSITINMGLIPPVSQAAGVYIEALDTFVEQHPDTVQAFVDAQVEAWAYAHLHPQSAERMFTSLEALNQVTSPDEVESIFQDDYRFWRTPVLLRSEFIYAEKITNSVTSPPITLTYSQWDQPKFALTAVKTLKLGIAVPTQL